MMFKETVDEYDLVRVAEASIEPVLLSDLQNYILGVNSADDDLLNELIIQARELFENHSGFSLLEQTWRLSLCQFYSSVQLPRRPFRSIVSIKYIDSDGIEQTLDPGEYQVSSTGVLTWTSGASIPSVDSTAHFPVVIEYTLGVYAVSGDPLAVDKDSAENPGHGVNHYRSGRLAIMVLVSHLYENRGVVAPVMLHEMPMSYRTFVDSVKIGFI